MTPTNLDELLASVKSGAVELSDDMPSFGGPEPSDTDGVWSWDASRQLSGTCASDVSIEPRLTEGSPVWFRGRFATVFSVRGTIECLKDETFGVRLENGNFAWAEPDQVQPRGKWGSKS